MKKDKYKVLIRKIYGGALFEFELIIEATDANNALNLIELIILTGQSYEIVSINKRKTYTYKEKK